MKTHGLTIKIKAKTPKNVRNCESWASLRLNLYFSNFSYFRRRQSTFHGVTSSCIMLGSCAEGCSFVSLGLFH